MFKYHSDMGHSFSIVVVVSKKKDFFFFFLLFSIGKTDMVLGKKVAILGMGPKIRPLEKGIKSPVNRNMLMLYCLQQISLNFTQE